MAGIDEASASPRINQYETGKHTPNPQMAERLARVLRVPAPYLYAKDDSLAEWILAYQLADPIKRRELVQSTKTDR
jgi:transcriptional regulator with XRE-family HTH domain